MQRQSRLQEALTWAYYCVRSLLGQWNLLLLSSIEFIVLSRVWRWVRSACYWFCGSDTSDLSCVPGGVLGSNGLSPVGLPSSFLTPRIMLHSAVKCYQSRAKQLILILRIRKNCFSFNHVSKVFTLTSLDSSFNCYPSLNLTVKFERIRSECLPSRTWTLPTFNDIIYEIHNAVKECQHKTQFLNAKQFILLVYLVHEKRISIV